MPGEYHPRKSVNQSYTKGVITQNVYEAQVAETTYATHDYIPRSSWEFVLLSRDVTIPYMNSIYKGLVTTQARTIRSVTGVVSLQRHMEVREEDP